METDQAEPVANNDISQGSALQLDQKPGPQISVWSRSEAILVFDKAVEEAARASKTDEHAVWHDCIYKTIKRHGIPTARQLWLKAMSHYASAGNMSDWTMVDSLHKRFHQKFWIKF